MERDFRALTRFMKGSGTCLTRLRYPQVMKRAIRSPRYAIRAAMGWWRIGGLGLDKLEFVARLLDTTVESVTSTLGELKTNKALYQHLRNYTEVGVPKGHTTGAMAHDVGEVLYLLVRLLKPEVVVETGVAAGISSCFILQAEEDNRTGRLYSIDLHSPGHRLEDGLTYHMPQGRQSGWVIPDNLKYRLHLILGDARETLPPLLDQLSSIDIFLHDSLHTFKHQKWEYETAYPFVNKGGLLLSHDIGKAFLEFCGKHGAPYIHYKYLGGFVKKG